eukprot:scaffold10_cov257-Pinguiococcus_pyrenoidosus.AAC.47
MASHLDASDTESMGSSPAYIGGSRDASNAGWKGRSLTRKSSSSWATSITLSRKDETRKSRRLTAFVADAHKRRIAQPRRVMAQPQTLSAESGGFRRSTAGEKRVRRSLRATPAIRISESNGCD